MSAEVPVSHSTGELPGFAQALYFNSGDRSLFGWLHRSPESSHADLGVVICKPFGYEAICAHRGVRAFAERIASAGMPALRFDYLGTGDSPDIEPQANQIDVWTKDVLSAAEELKTRTGVRHVCLLGFRLGALVATLAAAGSEAISGLILIAPIVSGRRYLKELRTLRMAAAMGVDTSESEVDKQGGMEVSGFVFSAATLAALAKVDFTGLQSLPDTLVIEGVNASTTARLPDAPRRTSVALPGLVEMLMTAPQFAQAPKEIIGATRNWLSTLAQRLAATPTSGVALQVASSQTAAAIPTLLLGGGTGAPHAACTEKPVFFGTAASLFGIVTQPPASEIRRRAVVLLNAGADYHIGASRLYVSLARRWARHGYVVLRMDLGGVGDSATRAGRLDDDVFPQEAIMDIRAAVELLKERYGIRDVTLAGLCSGAYHALRAAVAGLPVSRILMINPQNYFWKQGETLQGLQLAEVVHNPGVYRERIFSMAAWKKMFTGQVSITRIAKIYLQRPLLTVESKLRDIARLLHIRLPSDLGTELEQIVARGVRVVFVFARGEPGISLLQLQAGSSVARLADRCHIHILSSGDHVFTRSGPRALMEKAVSDELFARPERLDPPSAKLSTAGGKL